LKEPSYKLKQSNKTLLH